MFPSYSAKSRHDYMSRAEIALRLSTLMISNRVAGAAEARIPMSAFAKFLGVSRETLYQASRSNMTARFQRHVDFALRRIENGLKFKRAGQHWLLDCSEEGNPNPVTSAKPRTIFGQVSIGARGPELQLQPKRPPPETLPSFRSIFRRDD